MLSKIADFIRHRSLRTINEVLPYPAYQYTRIIVPSLLASEEKHLACPQKTAESALAAQQAQAALSNIPNVLRGIRTVQ